MSMSLKVAVCLSGPTPGAERACLLTLCGSPSVFLWKVPLCYLRCTLTAGKFSDT